MKIYTRTTLSFILMLSYACIWASCLYADTFSISRRQIINSALDQYEQNLSYRKTPIKYSSPPQNLSKDADHLDIFIKNLSYGTVLQSKQKPQIYIEGLLPLYTSENKQNVMFTQMRFNSQDGNSTYNGGLGYRHSNEDNTIALGVNSFIDYTNRHDHLRASLGWEILAYNFEGRGNFYIGLSDEKIVEETSTTRTFEKVANGHDVEIGGGLPNSDFFKLFLGYSQFKLPHAPDQKGWKMRAQIKPYPFTTLNFESFDQYQDDTEYQLDGRFSLPVFNFTPKEIIASFKNYGKSQEIKKITSPNSKKMYQRVERENKIIVDRWQQNLQTSSGSVDMTVFVTFPTLQNPGVDPNGNGFVDAGEEFELNFKLVNNTNARITNIQLANGSMTLVNGAFVSIIPQNGALGNPTEPGGDNNAEIGETVTTDQVSDLDFVVPIGVSVPGASVTFSIDVTYDGNTQTVTFGTGTIGTMSNNQVFNQL